MPRTPAPTARLLTTLLAACLLLAGCQATEDVAVGGSPSPTASDPLDVIGTDVPTVPAPGTDDPAGDRAAFSTYRGTFGGSAIEGGCVWLDAEDGTRYQVVPTPDSGLVLDTEAFSLLAADGTTIAGDGDPVVVEGAADPEAMSFCQVGPILLVRSAGAG